MWSYTIKRLLLAIPTLFGITIITFLLLHLAPGDPAQMLVGVGGTMNQNKAQEIIERTRERFGLDQPLPVQYWRWLKNVMVLDFGQSFDDYQPVTKKIVERLPVSLQLSLGSLLLSYLIAVPIGVYFATKQGTLPDQITTVTMFMLYSVPNFWLATLALVFLCGGDFLRIFPTIGLQSFNFENLTLGQKIFDRLHHLFLPMVCMTYASLAYLSRYARAGMLEVIRQDYIQTARAKGLKEKTVIFKHAFRNSMIPLLTLLASLLPALIGGSVIVETIFEIPGMGRLAFEAVLQRDYPTIMGIFTISSVLTLVGFLISDLLYAWADPRISFEGVQS